VDTLIDAILDDDLAKAREALAADMDLAIRLTDEARLYRGKICHWIYVGDTALHLAAAGYRLEIVDLLLRAGADPNSAKNHRRGRPLHYAADGNLEGSAWNPNRQVKTIRRLLRGGADINAADKNGATALHRAVRTRCAAAVQCLLKAGSDPALRNKPGSTPFHLAVQDTGRGGAGTAKARAAQKQIIEQFLAFGVSTGLRDGKGKSVVDSARSE
jgi:hypothetical protein